MALKTKLLKMPNNDTFEFLGATYYGECTTSASSQNKEVTIGGIDENNLEPGLRIVVRMAYAQSYDGHPTLNVSDSGNKAIYSMSNKQVGVNAWSAGEIVAFVYFSGNWYIEGAGASNEPCYQTGDTLSMTLFPITGIITSSGKEIRLAVEVGKSLKNISTITVTACSGGIRGVSGLVNSLSDPNWLTRSGVTVSASKVTDNHITIAISSSSAFSNVTNNTPLCMWPSNFALSFS